jgi:hypothetical protein
VFEWLPEGVEWIRDVSAADWLTATVEPWSTDDWRLASFMPAGFEAYVRVFHPFRDPDRIGPSRLWREVAAEAGVVLGPGTTEREVDDLSDQGRLPEEGSMPDEICATLRQILPPKTSTPDVCWFALWSGLGTFTDDEYAAPQIIHEPYQTSGRSYLLFRGPVEAVCSFEPRGWNNTPSFWWPDDRAWAVVTEIDGTSTYVGGTRNTIDGFLSNGVLETIEVDRDVRIN